MFKTINTITLLILLPSMFMINAQDTLKHRKFAFMLGLQASSAENIGPFRKSNPTRDEYFMKTMNKRQYYAFLGCRYKNSTHYADIGYISEPGAFDLETPYFGGDYLKSRYLGYQFSYDFFGNKPFLFKPYGALNLTYAYKRYTYNNPSSVGVSSYNSKEESNSFLLQIPLGVSFDSKFVNITFTYNVPVVAWIKGTFYSRYFHESYSSTTEIIENIDFQDFTPNKNYQSNYRIFTLRVGAYIPGNPSKTFKRNKD